MDLWAPIGGEGGRLYRYIGSDDTLDLSLQDYTDTALWGHPLGGDEGLVYQWMGPNNTSVDLLTPAHPYDDPDWWSPTPRR